MNCPVKCRLQYILSYILTPFPWDKWDVACVAGVRRGGKGERRASEAREDRTREDRSIQRSFWLSSLPFYGLPRKLNEINSPWSYLSMFFFEIPSFQINSFFRFHVAFMKSWNESRNITQFFGMFLTFSKNPCRWPVLFCCVLFWVFDRRCQYVSFSKQRAKIGWRFFFTFNSVFSGRGKYIAPSTTKLDYSSHILDCYMARSVNREDEPNRSVWLATRAGKIELSWPLGITRPVPREKGFPKANW